MYIVNTVRASVYLNSRFRRAAAAGESIIIYFSAVASWKSDLPARSVRAEECARKYYGICCDEWTNLRAVET